MKNYDEMIKGLQKDIDVPQDVQRKIRQALAGLPEQEGKTGRRSGLWMKTAAAAVAVVFVGTGVCYANPALAAKIPVIGKIFEQVEEKVRFKGDYSGKGEILTETGTATEADASEKEKDADAALYLAKDQGVEVNASEIYCDGLSVFLTAEITVEEGKLTNIPGYDYIKEHGIEDEHLILYTRGSWRLEGEKESTELLNDHFEGMVLDDNTFIGMLKLDLAKTDITEGVLELSLSRIGYDDIEMSMEDDITESHKIDGSWEFSIPFHVDHENVKEVEIAKKLENGYTLEKVVATPYQIVVYGTAPYTALSEDAFSREEFEAQKAAERTNGDSEDEGITYEEFLAQQGSYAFYDVVVYDADGETLEPCDLRLPAGGEGSIRGVFPVQNRDVSDIQIYMFDDMDPYLDAQKGDLDTAKSTAILSAEVEF